MLVLSATPKQKLHQVAFSPVGFGLAAAGDRGGYWWPNPSESPVPHRVGEPIKQAGKASHGIGFTSDGLHLLDSRPMMGVMILRIADERYQFFRLAGPIVQFSTCPTEPLAVARNSHRGELTCWRVGPDSKFQREWVVEPGELAAAGPPAFSPDGRCFAYPACRDVQTAYALYLVLRRTSTGEHVRTLHLSDPVGVLPVISPTGDQLVYGQINRLSGAQLSSHAACAVYVVTNDTKQHFTGIAFHPSGRYLAATSNDATVKLYDTATWAVARTFAWDIGRLRSVAFSPDGTRAAVGSDTGKVLVWDVDV